MSNSVKAMSFIGSGTELQLLTCQLLQHFIQQLCVYQHDQRNGKISQTSMWAMSGYVTQKLYINNEQWSEEHDYWISTLSLYCQNNCRLVAAIQVSKAVRIKVISNKYLVYSLSYLCWSFHCKTSQKEDYKNTGFPLHYMKAGKLYQLVMKNYIVAKKSLTHFLQSC